MSRRRRRMGEAVKKTKGKNNLIQKKNMMGQRFQTTSILYQHKLPSNYYFIVEKKDIATSIIALIKSHSVPFVPFTLALLLCISQVDRFSDKIFDLVKVFFFFFFWEKKK